MGPEQGFESTGLYMLRAIIALVGVLALIMATSWLLRRFSGNRIAANGQIPNKAHLEVLQAVSIDTRRKMVMVRRDNVAHLLLVGGTSDIVVENNIPIADLSGNKASEPKPAPSSPAQGVKS